MEGIPRPYKISFSKEELILISEALNEENNYKNIVVKLRIKSFLEKLNQGKE